MINLQKPKFEKQMIKDKLPNGYWIQSFPVFDQKVDLICYGLDKQSQISLFKNPTWARAPISVENGPVGMTHADISRNGKQDIVICYQYGETMEKVDQKGGNIHWLENPGSTKEQWKKHYIGRSTAMHRLIIGHFTQSEKWQVLGLPIVEKAHDIHSIVSIKLFREPINVLNAQKWEQELIDDIHFRVIHEVSMGKYNQIFGIKPESKLDSFLLASEEGITWLYYDQDLKKWEIVRVGEGEKSQPVFKGSGGVSLGKMGNDLCAYIAAIEPFHGNTIAVYYKVKKDENAIKNGWQWQWKRVVLDTFDNPNQNNEGPCHYVVCGDFDGDGDDQFLVTLRGPQPWQGVYYYKCVSLSQEAWCKWKVSNQSAARIAVADYSSDGRLDFATIGYSVKGYHEAQNPSICIFYNTFAPKPLPCAPIKSILSNESINQNPQSSPKVNPKVELIKFSTDIVAKWITNNKQYLIQEKSIVINLGVGQVIIKSNKDKILKSRESIILKNTTILNAHEVLIFQISDNIDLGKIVSNPEWKLLGDMINTYPKDVPLYKSTQFDLGAIKMDPVEATDEGQFSEKNLREYNLKVNLWYSPSKTNCGLHRVHKQPHDFFEVHTQIYGIGRMQKFADQNLEGNQLFQGVKNKLTYEEILSQGNTHKPFASLNENGQFVYPWHQYYAETQCVWIAHQYHVKENS